MTKAVIGFDYSSQLSIAGVVKLGISGKENEFSRPLSPFDLVVANHSLGKVEKRASF